MTEKIRRVLDIPELRHEICSRLSREDAARVVLVSRAFFHSAIARIWGDGFVPAEHLMNVLPQLEPLKGSSNPSILRKVRLFYHRLNVTT